MVTLFTEDEVEDLLSSGEAGCLHPQLEKITKAYCNAKSMAEERRLVHQATIILRNRQKREMEA